MSGSFSDCATVEERKLTTPLDEVTLSDGLLKCCVLSAWEMKCHSILVGLGAS